MGRSSIVTLSPAPETVKADKDEYVRPMHIHWQVRTNLDTLRLAHSNTCALSRVEDLPLTPKLKVIRHSEPL